MEQNFLEDDVWFFKYRTMHIDMMDVFIKRYAGHSDITSWSLDFISKYFLGYGKVDAQMGGGKGYKLYEENFAKFKEYNLQDAKILYDLNDKVGTVDQIILECQITGTFASQFSISEMLDNYILRSTRHKDIHFPSIEYSENQIRCPGCNQCVRRLDSREYQPQTLSCSRR